MRIGPSASEAGTATAITIGTAIAAAKIRFNVLVTLSSPMRSDR
jgi:hypothetical protein